MYNVINLYCKSFQGLTRTSFTVKYCMDSRYKNLIFNALKYDEIMSTNQVREVIKKPAGVKYIEFNLVYRLLEQLEHEGKVEKLKGPKKSYYWKRK